MILLKNAQSKTFKKHFNTNTLWNLEFAFTRYKTLFNRARFPYKSLMRTKQNQIYLLPLLFFASFMKNQHYDFFPIMDTDHFTLSENNFSLSQFLQIKV